ncbi:MAG: response regulator [Verrucomicrobiaceae bacterium]|nr:response regulator [Verrucomicrobiaceae bacterium]
MKHKTKSPGGGQQMPRILVIDDDASLRETMRIILHTSFRVTTVPSVDAAIEELGHCLPDGIIMDLSMPIKDGLQGLREIRPLHPSLPIIMLTGYADSQTSQQALELGASEIMRKPFDLVELITRISKITEAAQTTQAKQDSVAAV